MSTSKDKRCTNKADDESEQKNEGNETARVETPGLLRNKRIFTQEDLLAHYSSGTKQTDVSSCLKSAQEKEKQNW